MAAAARSPTCSSRATASRARRAAAVLARTLIGLPAAHRAQWDGVNDAASGALLRRPCSFALSTPRAAGEWHACKSADLVSPAKRSAAM